jgi:signal transduction histidine kinase
MNADRQSAFARAVAWVLLLTAGLALLIDAVAIANGANGGDVGGYLALTYVGLGVVGTLIVRRAHNQIGWIFVLLGAGAALAAFSSAMSDAGEVWDIAHPEWWRWWNDIGFLAIVFALAPLFLLFPDGHLPSPRWRWIARLYWAGVGMSLLWSLTAIEEDNVDGVLLRNPTHVAWPPGFTWVLLNIGGALAIGAGLVSVSALIVRYRRARGDERLQLRWVVAVVASGAICFVFANLTEALAPDSSFALTVADVSFLVMVTLVLIGLPVAVTIAVFRYKLYAIDVVISKAIVVAGLALFISVVYVAIVVGIGTVLGSDNVALRIAATAAVAVLFQPARERMHRLAGRIVYGERATPYEVLARFSERVGGAYAAEDVLPRTARVIAEGVGAAEVEIWLHVGAQLALGASWPARETPTDPIDITGDDIPPIEADHFSAVRLRGELLGAITVTKPRGEPLTHQEVSLIDHLAEQSALVLANVRLTADLEARLATIERQASALRASRQRIVAAQDEERRRLERNIHDGAQQHLVALAVKLRLAKATIGKDPERAEMMLRELRDQVAEALDTLRSLALGVYPPLLEEQGIAAALAGQYTRSDLPVHVMSDELARYPVEIEAAVYFCVLEALQNAAKYASASRIEVTLADVGSSIAFEVRDDGRGFDSAVATNGTGLQGMRDRLAVFGGEASLDAAPGRGTTVRGRVPVDAATGARA